MIVGGQGYPSVATLWDGSGAHTIAALVASTPDFTSDCMLDDCRAVSDDGKWIAGEGTHSGGREGWVVHLP